MAHRFFKYCIGLAGIVALSSFFVPEQAIASQLFPEVVLSSEEEAGDALKNDVVCLDISQGDIYISSEGYSREDDGTLTALKASTGSAETAARIMVFIFWMASTR